MVGTEHQKTWKTSNLNKGGKDLWCGSGVRLYLYLFKMRKRSSRNNYQCLRGRFQNQLSNDNLSKIHLLKH